MADEKKYLRKRKDGQGYEAIRLGPGGASYDAKLTEDTARKMWAQGGYDELDEDAVDFEAARLLAGADSSMGLPSGVALTRRDDGDFDLTREYAGGASMGQRVPRGVANSLANLGGERVRLSAPATPQPVLEQDPGDAKRDGLSNPTARPAQDWTDGPRNPNPMPRAGPKKPAPRIQVGMPAQGGGASAARAPAEATRTTPVPGARKPLPPLVANYMAQRFGDQDPFAAARREASRNRLGVQLARAGGMANEALSGARLDGGAYDDLETQSQEPLEDFAARRKMGQEDEEARGREGERRLRAEDAQRRWDADARDFRYRTERDAVEDQRADVRLTAEERRAADDRALRWASLKEQRASRASMEEARAQERKDAAAAKETQMRERQDEKDMAELGKRTDKLAQTKADVETVNRLLAQGGDIPGAGVWDSVKMTNAFTRALFASQEDVESWQASQRMAANYLNTMTGQSFTPLEAERTLARYGVAPGATEQEWRAGMTAFIRDVKSGLVQKEAPFSHVVPEFRSRGGVTAQDIPEPAQQAPRPTGRVKRVGGRVYMEMSDGTAVEARRG